MITHKVREELVTVARDVATHTSAGTVRLVDEVMSVPAARYTDPAHFDLERARVFRRVPVMVAASCEIPHSGDRRAVDIAGVPVLVVRGRDGQARAFLNACTHRGAVLTRGCASGARITCPYHAWVFDDQGALVGISGRHDFGEVDTTELGLRRLPVLEHAGLVWAVLDPHSTIDMAGFLGPFGAMLEQFGLASWHVVGRRELAGANWKLAFDAHLEFYHLPVLHRATFGAETSPKALYYHWGPHQRLVSPGRRTTRQAPAHADLFDQLDRPEEEWTDEAMLLGEWIIYPNVSINSFYRGGRGVLISQVLPGDTVDSSVTVQTYLTQDEPDDDARAAATSWFDFLGQVVGDEDLPTSLDQQRTLSSGLLPTVCFGRNEGGLQAFHRWTEQIIATDDAGLDALFASPGDR